MPKMTFVESDGTRREVNAPLGWSVLEIAHDNDIDIEGACGGSISCSTCHVIVAPEWFAKLAAPEEDWANFVSIVLQAAILGAAMIAAHVPRKVARFVLGSIAVVVVVSAGFFRSRGRARAEHTLAHIRNSARRFLAYFAEWPAETIRPAALQAYKEQLQDLGLADKTVNHHVAAAKSILRFGSAMELIPACNLDAVQMIPLRRPAKKGYSPKQVGDMWARSPPHVRHWIALHWHTLARPMEMVRLVNGWGEWIEPWLFRPEAAKTSGRHLVLTRHALSLLSRCEARWTRLDSYGTAVWRACGRYPHPIRHGAAQYLVRRGVDRATIDLVLGHVPSRVSSIYNPIRYDALRETIGLLGLSLSA